MMGLKDRDHHRPGQLSGGEQQRVAIARSLANKPKVLIADEPTTALDVTIQAQIMDLLAAIKAEHDMAMLLITHDLGVMSAIADRVVYLADGHIVGEIDQSAMDDVAVALKGAAR
mgnify:CR=1 FL=1